MKNPYPAAFSSPVAHLIASRAAATRVGRSPSVGEGESLLQSRPLGQLQFNADAKMVWLIRRLNSMDAICSSNVAASLLSSLLAIAQRSRPLCWATKNLFAQKWYLELRENMNFDGPSKNKASRELAESFHMVCEPFSGSYGKAFPPVCWSP